jgi:drug/metabolite transporter (DMT)-like permease
MNRPLKPKSQQDWISKTLAGLLLGLSMAIAIGVSISLLSLEHVPRMLAPQLGMWCIAWVWMPAFFAAYFFRKGWHAWLCYLLLNLLCYAFVWFLRA